MKEKADSHLKKAEKRLKGWSLFSNKYDSAAEDLEKAANNYKLAKCWDEAAQAFEKLAHCQNKIDSAHEAATSLVEAGKCYRKNNPKQAQNCLDRACRIYLDMGRLSIAAKHFQDMGEIAEGEDDIDSALSCYERAADLYMGEEQTSNGCKCTLKAAHLRANKEKYEEALNGFLEVARRYVEWNLLKYSVPSLLLNAGICALCAYEPVEVKNFLGKCEDIDATFKDTREYQLLEDLSQAYEQGDAEKFTEAEYDSMTKLDSWRTSTLLKAKKRVAAAELEGDDLT